MNGIDRIALKRHQQWLRSYLRSKLAIYCEKQANQSINYANQVIAKYQVILDALVDKYEEKYKLVMVSFPDLERYKVVRIFDSNNPIDVRPLLEADELTYLDKHMMFKSLRDLMKELKLQPDAYFDTMLV
jgi:hypothetical protein